MSPRLLLAFALSLALHVGVGGVAAWRGLHAAPRPAVLLATLPPLAVSEEPRVAPEPRPAETLLKNTVDPERKKRKTPPSQVSPPLPDAAQTTPRPISRRDRRQILAAQHKLAQHVFYPPEAVVRGLEGEVQVLVRLSPDGRIVEAKVVTSSGNALLDRAAVAAAYEMGGLSGIDLHEILLPVIFRLE